MNEPDLKSIGIVNFSHFADSLDLCDILLGNGFSINLCNRLSYRSLFDLFKENKSPELIQLFTKLKTTNFEFVIEMLNNTVLVNDIYAVDNSVYPSIVEELKKGLIEAIGTTHPLYKEIVPETFRSLSIELSRFGHIFTTNYDVFLYKIILAYNELLELKLIEGIRYKDDFCEEVGPHHLRLSYFYEECKVIHYLHGSLFIYNENFTYKFRKGGEADEYIRLLNREIQHGNFPLFVAEGSSSDKSNAISNNYYLTNCLNSLKQATRQLMVYGFSFQNSDKHITDTINNSGVIEIFISVYVGSKTQGELEKEATYFRNLFPNKSVVLYNSRSLFTFSPKYVF